MARSPVVISWGSGLLQLHDTDQVSVLGVSPFHPSSIQSRVIWWLLECKFNNSQLSYLNTAKFIFLSQVASVNTIHVSISDDQKIHDLVSIKSQDNCQWYHVTPCIFMVIFCQVVYQASQLLNEGERFKKSKIGVSAHKYGSLCHK